MTYFNSSNNIIETDDIHDIQGVHVTQEDGKTVAWLKAILNPAKDFQSAKDFWVHLTNGVEHRTIGPVPALTPLVPIPASSHTDDSTATSTGSNTSSPTSPEPTEDDTPTGPIPVVSAEA